MSVSRISIQTIEKDTSKCLKNIWQKGKKLFIFVIHYYYYYYYKNKTSEMQRSFLKFIPNNHMKWESAAVLSLVLEEWGVSWTLLPGNKGHDLGIRRKKKKPDCVLLFLKLLLTPDSLTSFRVGLIKQGKMLFLSLGVDGMRTGSCSRTLVWVHIWFGIRSVNLLQPFPTSAL